MLSIYDRYVTVPYKARNFPLESPGKDKLFFTYGMIKSFNYVDIKSHGIYHLKPYIFSYIKMFISDIFKTRFYDILFSSVFRIFNKEIYFNLNAKTGLAGHIHFTQTSIDTDRICTAI